MKRIRIYSLTKNEHGSYDQSHDLGTDLLGNRATWEDVHGFHECLESLNNLGYHIDSSGSYKNLGLVMKHHENGQILSVHVEKIPASGFSKS